MRQAFKEDKALVLDILCQSFDDNISVNYVIKGGASRLRHIKVLMEYSFDMCLAFGEVWISDDNSGCYLIKYSNKERSTLQTTLWELRLVFSSFGVGKVKAVLDRQGKIKSNYPQGDHVYLWYIGVLPNNQGNGIGHELLQHLLTRAKDHGLPVLLETSMQNNLPFYKKSDFTVYEELEFDHTLYMLKHD